MNTFKHAFFTKDCINSVRMPVSYFDLQMVGKVVLKRVESDLMDVAGECLSLNVEQCYQIMVISTIIVM